MAAPGMRGHLIALAEVRKGNGTPSVGRMFLTNGNRQRTLADEVRGGLAFEGTQMEKVRIPLPAGQIQEFCRRWRIVEFSLFGSVLRDDFGPESDVDILVTFAEDAHWGLFDLGRMEGELRGILGREVDLVTRRSVEESPNPIRRDQILNHLETIHAQG